MNSLLKKAKKLLTHKDYKSLSNWFKILYYYTRYIKKDYKITKGRFAIVNFDRRLKSDDHYRFFYTLCQFLEAAGYKVIAKVSWRDFKTFRIPYDYNKNVLRSNYILVRKCSTPLNTIVIKEDNTPNYTIHFYYGHTIIESGTYDCVLNYHVHPEQFEYFIAPGFLPPLQHSKRSIKVLFAGGNETKYNFINERTNYKVIPRTDVIKFIKATFEKNKKLRVVTDKDALKKILISNNYNNEIFISEVTTAKEDWLKILSKVDFFICPPGVRMPWSHNCIEAMSVGTIPILEYADLFTPHLENLKNCLTYADYNSLQAALERALQMDETEVEKMHRNVLDYYNKYLSINTLIDHITTFRTFTNSKLRVAIPFIPTQEEWKLYLLKKEGTQSVKR